MLHLLCHVGKSTHFKQFIKAFSRKFFGCLRYFAHIQDGVYHEILLRFQFGNALGELGQLNGHVVQAVGELGVLSLILTYAVVTDQAVALIHILQFKVHDAYHVDGRQSV